MASPYSSSRLTAAQWVARARAAFAKGEITWAKCAAYSAASAACEDGQTTYCPFDPASEPVLHEAWMWWYPRAAQVVRERQLRTKANEARRRDGDAAAARARKAENTRRALAARSPALAEQLGIVVPETDPRNGDDPNGHDMVQQ